MAHSAAWSTGVCKHIGQQSKACSPNTSHKTVAALVTVRLPHGHALISTSDSPYHAILVVTNNLATTSPMQTAFTARVGGGVVVPLRARLPMRRAPCVARAAGSAEWTGRQFTMLSTGDGATAHLAELIAGAGLRPGDAFCLKGDEGASQDIFV
jgi:hypothetical protein